MKRTSSRTYNALRSLLQWRCRSPQSASNRGFTLIELLVVVIIAGGIISGLMYLVVELLTADQREASRNQTQQEMQMAMDYISSELREAVYIYDEDCMGSTAQGSVGDAAYCPGLLNHLPSALSSASGSYPIIAFWKHQPIPTAIKQACSSGTRPADFATDEEFNGLCIAGNSYSLVVYALSNDNPSGIWDGQARITRYALTEFDSSGDRNVDEGYVNPGGFSHQFRSWPYYRDSDDTTPTNQQTGTPSASGSNPAVLVDFVDFAQRGTMTCPANYTATASATSLASSNSFYACVSNSEELGENREVVLYLRGNAYGRPTIGSDTTFLPTLETRVLSRPVISKQPTTN